ncbi:hypothetical protein D3C72_1480750 [compost metagenome]
MDVLKHPGQLGGGFTTQHAQFRKAQYGLQGGAQLVAHVGHKLGFGSRGFFSRVSTFLGSSLCCTELAHIHQDAQYSSYPPVLVGNGRLGDACVSARSVTMQHLGLDIGAPAPTEQLHVGSVVHLGLIRREELDQFLPYHRGSRPPLVFLPRAIDTHDTSTSISHRDGQRVGLQQQVLESNLRL